MNTLQEKNDMIDELIINYAQEKARGSVLNDELLAIQSDIESLEQMKAEHLARIKEINSILVENNNNNFFGKGLLPRELAALNEELAELSTKIQIFNDSLASAHEQHGALTERNGFVSRALKTIKKDLAKEFLKQEINNVSDETRAQLQNIIATMVHSQTQLFYPSLAGHHKAIGEAVCYLAFGEQQHDSYSLLNISNKLSDKVVA